VTSLATPSLSRTSSPDEDHRVSPTPDASSLAFFQLTEIPIEQIHLHVGSFYYTSSSIPASSPYKRGSAFSSSSTSLASMSSTLSRKLRFGSARLLLKAKTAPAVPFHPPPRRETGPAITIAPPDSPPAEVFRPSIQRLMSRHMNSSLSRHPLAGKNVSAVSSVPKPPSSSTTSNSSTGFLSHVKSRAKKTLSPIESNLQTKPSLTKPVSRDGGLLLHDPLGPEEIEGNYLEFFSVAEPDADDRFPCLTYN
jgi:hypothetical protein